MSTPVVAEVAGYTHVGCFVDVKAQRVLANAEVRSRSMVPDWCRQYCEADSVSYTYFGVEAWEWCYCGRWMVTTDTSGPVDAGNCTYGCSGDNSQLCGADLRINIYSKLPSGVTVTRGEPQTVTKKVDVPTVTRGPPAVTVTPDQTLGESSASATGLNLGSSPTTESQSSTYIEPPAAVLPLGAIISLAVGAAIFLILAAVVTTIFLVRRRRQRQRQARRRKPRGDAFTVRSSEANPPSLWELHGSDPPVAKSELPGSTPRLRSELGNWTRHSTSVVP